MTTPTKQHHEHYKMYKPSKCLSQFVYTHSHGQRKRKSCRLLGDVIVNEVLPPGIMAIGRLDKDSEGLLLLTTDGKLSNAICRNGFEKEYWVQCMGVVSRQALARLQGGVEISLPSGSYTTLPCKARRLETQEVVLVQEEEQVQEAITACDGLAKKKRKFKGTCNKCGLRVGHKAADCTTTHSASTGGISNDTGIQASATHPLPPGIPARIVSSCHGPTSWVSICITEGKFRQVRKMTAAVGYPTLRLVRVRIGSITLDGMAVGQVQPLKDSAICEFIS